MEILEMPLILTANTYSWIPAAKASARRGNEKNRQKQVFEFFESLGFEVTTGSNSVTAKGFDLEISFYYSESAQHVYKSLAIYKKGKKSNISAIKKLLKKEEA